ncbi:transmembrane protein 53 [Drosophila kikkawai]|uniref:Transmembrane protein 53 n=1 Tax=Drosophila kikkawai TaxID=30033 RepID=A0A6P4JAX2_DROKI|nr:transmembrane protein 53 [Drosophila kikkawai]XP_017032160.1 transmembrane protein 53 [Drosophila kikkawai]
MPSPSSHPYGLTVDDIASQYGAATATIHNSETRQGTVTRRPPPDREDALEYFIKFPKSSVQNDLANSNANGEDNVPIVILLGWAGCKDRYLMKYSKIYEERGLITVRYTAPVDTLFWKRAEMVPIGEKILKLIQDMNFDAHPLIFHIFSNGGAYLYQHINLAVINHKSPLDVRGVIFDSAPGERRMLGLYRAIIAIYGREKRCNCLTALAITLTLSIMWFVEESFAAFKNLFIHSSAIHPSPFCELKNESNKFPQMFLYSKGDDVIPYRDVEKFIRLRRDRGIEVSAVCFEDAEHVKIYTKYPKQYVQCVCNFIKNCMGIPYSLNMLPDCKPSLSSSGKQNRSNLKYD